MNELVYPRERTLGALTLVLGLLVWLALVVGTQGVRDALGKYYEAKEAVPESLQAIGLESKLADGSMLTLDTRGMALTVKVKRGEVIFTPTANDDGSVSLGCSNGEGIKPTQLPPSCQSAQAR